MASERKFWKAFTDGVGRPDLYERWPGADVADHARGNRELRAELRTVFAARSTAEWVTFGAEHDVPIAPVHAGGGLLDDPNFRARSRWTAATADAPATLETPLRFGTGAPSPTPAPTPGADTDAVLRSVLGYDDTRLDALRATGAIG